MPQDRSPNRPIVVAAAWFLVIAATLTALVVGASFLIPLAVSLIVWYLINGIARGVRRFGIGAFRPPFALCLGVAVLIIIAFFVLIGDLVASNVSAVSESAPVYEKNVQDLMIKFAGWFGLTEVPTITSLVERINIGQLIATLAGSLSGFIADAGLVLVYVLFLLFEQAVFDRKLKFFIRNPDREQNVRLVLARISKEIETYIWIKTATSLMTGVISYVVLILVGVDYAVFWGFLIFLLAYIPTIGSLLGIMFPAVLSLLQFGDWQPFLLTLVPLAAAQIVIGNVIEPRMMGRSLNLSPLVVMGSLILWSSLWGVPGAFLCVPITVIFLIICTYVPSMRGVAILLSVDGSVEAVPKPTRPVSGARPATGPGARPAAHGASDPPTAD